MTEKVRVCLVGCGRAGMVHGYNLKSFVPNAQLVAVVDADPTQAQRAAETLRVQDFFFSLEMALENVKFEAVVITTPTFTHASLIVTAAEAGKHVFTEKPLCVTLEEADRIEASIRKSNVKFQIGFMRRFDESYMRAKDLVDQGAIGEPILVKSVGRGPGLPPPWYADPQKSNGLLAEVNSHDFDALRWFAEREITEVFAYSGNFKCPEYKNLYPNFYDTVTVNLRFENGILGVIDGCCPATYGYDARMEILGTEGLILIGVRHPYSVVVWNRENQLLRDGNPSWRNLFREAYRAELAHFIECILQDKEPRVGLEDGRKALEAVLAANLSIRSGQPVKLSTSTQIKHAGSDL